MIIVKPFRALRPTKENAKNVVSLPYDVMNRQEAKKMAEGNRDSFLHIIRSEIDLPDSVPEETASVYEKARENLEDFLRRGVLTLEDSPAFYIYSQTFMGKTQTGICALCSTKQYEEGKIKRHEHTFPKKEIDRVNNFLYCGAHTEPVFLAHKPSREISAVVSEITKSEPYFDFATNEGVLSKLWIADDEESISKIQTAFAGLEALYIADGHHRTQSSYLVSKKVDEANEEAKYIMSVIFPQEQLNILPYNRILKDISPYSPQELPDILAKDFDVAALHCFTAPKTKHNFALYLDKKWYALTAKDKSFDASDSIKSLDVSILQDNVFRKLFGVDDPRIDDRLRFVGGIKGERYLKDEVDKNPSSCAFVLYGVDFSDITKIADAGGVMPPKSTWFEPKLSSGLLIHKFN